MFATNGFKRDNEGTILPQYILEEIKTNLFLVKMVEWGGGGGG